MFEEEITNLGLIAIITIIHELGHIITYVAIRKKFPKIKFKWYAILIGDEKDNGNFTLREMTLIAMSGVYAGLLCLIAIVPSNLSYFFLFAYTIMSLLDLNILISFIANKGLRDIKLKYIKVIAKHSKNDILRHTKVCGFQR